MSYPDTTILEVVEHVKNCVCASLIEMAERNEGHPTCPCKMCAVPGTTVGQQTECCVECGQLDGGSLKVNVDRVYPSTSFPGQDQNAHACEAASMAVEITVRLMRCVPVFDGDSPDGATCEQLQRAADVSNMDAVALYQAVACCIPERPGRRRRMPTVLRNLTSVSDGDCAGWDLELTVSLGTCGCGTTGGS